MFKHTLRKSLLSLFILTILPVYAQQAIEATLTFDTPQQHQQYQHLIKIIRCPTCQNQDIAESNAPLAKQLRDLIAEKTLAGENEQQITDYLISRYGDFITYQPRLQKNTLILWFAPILAMLTGLTIWLIRRKNKTISPTLNPEEKAQLHIWLQQYGE